MRRYFLLLLCLGLAGCSRPAKEIDPSDDAPLAKKSAQEGRREEVKKRSAYEERVATFRNAVEKGRVSEVKELLKTADVNDKDDDGQTPLMWAAAKGQTPVFLLLWNQGAMARERDAQGRTAVMLAAEGNHVEVLRFLLVPDQATRTAGTALKLAGLDVGKKLGFTGVPSTINDTDKKGRTALMLACAAGAREAAAEMMDPNSVSADVEPRDNQGKTALAYAAAAGQLGLVERILERFTEVKPGLDHVALKDQDGKTAADSARAAGHKAVAGVLEEYAKDPNARDDLGRTPLMRAIVAGERKALERLLGRGVDRLAQDKDGKTAAVHAAIKGDATTLTSLRYQHSHTFTTLLGWFNVADKQGKTPLMHAAANDHVRCVTGLIDEGWEAFGRGSDFTDYVVGLATAGDKEGRNALMYAAAAGNVAAARAILQAYGETTRAGLPGPEARKALLKRTDKAGNTAAQIAEEAKHPTVVELLKKYGG
jgi:ankyrin repeat protein